MSGEITERLIRAGMSASEAARKEILFEAAEDALPTENTFPIMRWFVPGRIEVLGKHTDYAGGRSILCAAERGICVAALARADSVVNIVDAVDGRRLKIDLYPDMKLPADGWAIYVMAVARRVARNFGGGLHGADIAIASDLPRSSGMSSSSALIVAIFSVLSEMNGLGERAEYQANISSGEELAEYLGCVENGRSYRDLAGDRGVGTFGGNEDHTAILCCRAGMLSQYSFCPVRPERTTKFPAEFTFVIASSGVEASKTDSAREKYNRVSLAAAEVLAECRRKFGVQFATLHAAAMSSADAVEQIGLAMALSANSEFSPETLVDRFCQFVLESEKIIPAASDALERGDLRAFGALVDESQLGAERGLGNQIPETIELARMARELGVVAASSFGAGFGGSVWAMVLRADAEQFCARWREKYFSRFGGRDVAGSEFFISAAGPGLLRL
ncbi:MAG TPA: galactokinase family protein [Candidatus Acidoferrales bacterium]